MVGLEAIAVGITRKVEPVPGPTLAILRRSQQPVHCLVVCVGRTVGQKGGHFMIRWRQADQIEGDAPQQRDLVSLRRWCQILAFEFARIKASIEFRTQPGV